MKAFNYSLLFLLPLFIPFTGSSQDQIFMNSSQSLLSLNPSFAGSNGRFRSQFSYINNPAIAASKLTYVTLVNTFDFYLNRLNAGVALSVTNDNTGSGRVVNSGLSLSYAHYLAADNGKLKIVPSLRVAYQQKRLDTRYLTFGDIADVRMSYFYPHQAPWMLTRPASQLQYLSFDAGLLVHYRERLFAGVSVAHINRPSVGMVGIDYRLPALINAHASYNLRVSDNALLNVSTRYTQQRNYYFTQLNALLEYHKYFLAGLGYIRDSGRSIPMASLGFKTKALLLSLSYGYAITDKALPTYPYYPNLINASGYRYGIWELNFSFRFGKRGISAPMAVEAW